MYALYLGVEQFQSDCDRVHVSLVNVVLIQTILENRDITYIQYCIRVETVLVNQMRSR